MPLALHFLNDESAPSLRVQMLRAANVKDDVRLVEVGLNVARLRRRAPRRFPSQRLATFGALRYLPEQLHVGARDRAGETVLLKLRGLRGTDDAFFSSSLGVREAVVRRVLDINGVEYVAPKRNARDRRSPHASSWGHAGTVPDHERALAPAPAREVEALSGGITPFERATGASGSPMPGLVREPLDLDLDFVVPQEPEHFLLRDLAGPLLADPLVESGVAHFLVFDTSGSEDVAHDRCRGRVRHLGFDRSHSLGVERRGALFGLGVGSALLE